MEHKMLMPNKPLNSTIFLEETGFDLQIRNGELYICGDLTFEEAQAALHAHNPQA